MASDSVFISRKGYEKMQKELAALKAKRPVIAQQILEAREKGDLKENAEYHAAKEDSAHNERRISELESKLGRAQILEDQGEISSTEVYIGATVKVKDESGEHMSFTLVDVSEADPTEGRISTVSPIGQALLGQAVGAKVKVPVGKAGYTLVIVEITRD